MTELQALTQLWLLLERMTGVLESLAMQADRYDAELDALRAELRAVSARVDLLTAPSAAAAPGSGVR